MPNTIAGDQNAAVAIVNAVFGSAASSNLNAQVNQWIVNWKAFYTANPAALVIPNPTAAQIDTAARAAAFGDAVDVAINSSVGPLQASEQNVLNNDDLFENAQAVTAYNIAVTTVPQAPPFQGGAQTSNVFTLTIGQDNIVGTQFGNNVFNAPLAGVFGNQPTLTNADSITAFGLNNVLKANFDGDHIARNLNIVDVQTWNIDQTGNPGATGTIELSGDGILGPNVISGLMTLNFNDDETSGSLSIGDNSSPVLEPNGANGFTITVTEAFGLSVGPTYHTLTNGTLTEGVWTAAPSAGVDVDIAASAFTGYDTINVTADVVGGFLETPDGSYIVCPPILVAPHDGDDYDPNWLCYLSDAFSISAGASSGPVTVGLPPTGAIGFANWVVTSEGAAAAGSLNIIALGGEGSWTAQTITLINPAGDSSNTMLFATAVSDSLSTDWSNLKTVTLTNTTGFVTLTGQETNVQEVFAEFGSTTNPLLNEGIYTAGNFAAAFQLYDGGGLLASDTAALTTILGGAGNSFYDLSSLSEAALAADAAAKVPVKFVGGSSVLGNSEVAFNNGVVAGTVPVTIQNIQILDDVSSIYPLTLTDPLVGPAILENDGEAQGGVINMNNFAGLAPLNVPYALLAEDLAPDGGVGAPVPFGLPYTAVPAGITSASSLATDVQTVWGRPS